ncbi:unnamed protein product [Closterium sp. Yama58-4]|nr:unnamed protein product [Closterium sp. Yama58-4]
MVLIAASRISLQTIQSSCCISRHAARTTTLQVQPRPVRTMSRRSNGARASFCDGGEAVAREGDMVNVKFVCKTLEGEVLHASGDDEVLTFEVGAGNFVGNPLFKGFDEAVKGLAVGQSRTIQSAPMAKTDDMIFRVPKDHEEIQRLTKEQGGELKAGAVVVLANGGPAEILEVGKDYVVIDANHPLAEQVIEFEVELVSIGVSQ